MTPTARPKALTVALVCLFGGMFATRPAPAAPPPSDRPTWQVIDVALPPLVDLALLDGAPFGPPTRIDTPPSSFDATQRISARRRVAIQRALLASLRRLDFVTALSDEEIRQRLHRDPLVQGHLTLGGERFDLGRERWLSVEATEALAHFERARESYARAFVDLLVPERWAEVEFHRGLALAELDRDAEALLAFRTMFLFDPSRRFTAGWYGPRVDTLLTTAALDARADRDAGATRYPPDRISAIAKAIGIEHWLVGLIAFPNDSNLRLDIEMVSLARISAVAVRTGSFDLHETIPVAVDPSPFTVPELVNRWFTAWHACALDHDAPTLGWRPPQRRTVFVDLAYRHDLWLTHRQTRLALHGPGFQVGLHWEPDPMFQLWARLGQVTTLIDARSDLLNEFSTTHLAAGGALRLGDDEFSAALRFGLTAAVSLNDFEATNDIDCKFLGATHPRCGSVFRADAPLLWFGFDASAMVRYHPHRSWYLAFGVGIAVYLWSPEAARELNHPLNLSMGFGAAF